MVIDPSALLAILQDESERRVFNELIELLCDYAKDEADAYLDWLRPQTTARITPHPVVLPSPTDFDAIYRHARSVAAQAAADVDGQADHLTFHLSPGTPAMAAVWIILAKTRFPAELIESSIQHGVGTVAIPFQISADFIPDLLRRPDAELTQLTAGLPPAAPAFEPRPADESPSTAAPLPPSSSNRSCSALVGCGNACMPVGKRRQAQSSGKQRPHHIPKRQATPTAPKRMRTTTPARMPVIRFARSSPLSSAFSGTHRTDR